MSRRATPDIEGIPFRATSQLHPWRAALGWRSLVEAPLAVAPVVTRKASGATQRSALRQWSTLLLAAAGTRVVVEGVEHIHSLDQPCVLASLHESFVDVPVLSTVPMDLRFTARQELFDHPDIGPLLAASDHIAIPETRTPAAMRALIESLAGAAEAGESIAVFPQGSLLGVEIAFQPGFWRIPRWLDLPVLPVTIAGSHLVWGYPMDDEVRFGRTVSVVIHEPIWPSEWSAERARRMEREMKATALALGTARRYRPEVDGWWDGYAFEIDADHPDLAAALATHRTG